MAAPCLVFNTFCFSLCVCVCVDWLPGQRRDIDASADGGRNKRLVSLKKQKKILTKNVRKRKKKEKKRRRSRTSIWVVVCWSSSKLYVIKTFLNNVVVVTGKSRKRRKDKAVQMHWGVPPPLFQLIEQMIKWRKCAPFQSTHTRVICYPFDYSKRQTAGNTRRKHILKVFYLFSGGPAGNRPYITIEFEYLKKKEKAPVFSTFDFSIGKCRQRGFFLNRFILVGNKSFYLLGFNFRAGSPPRNWDEVHGSSFPFRSQCWTCLNQKRRT